MFSFYKNFEAASGFGFWIDAYTFEDHYYVSTETKLEKNLKRYKRFGIFITFCKYQFEIRIPLKYVGTVYYGRILKGDRKNGI